MDDDRPTFVLLDDARESGAADAHYFEAPHEVFVARRPGEVAETLGQGGRSPQTIRRHAGRLYRLRGRAGAGRKASTAGAGTQRRDPDRWSGSACSDTKRIIPAGEVEAWLAERAEGQASLGPLEPQLSPGGYVEAFEKLQEAIRAGDIYQANLTFPLAGGYRGDPLALYAALRPAANAGYGGGNP